MAWKKHHSSEMPIGPLNWTPATSCSIAKPCQPVPVVAKNWVVCKQHRLRPVLHSDAPISLWSFARKKTLSTIGSRFRPPVAQLQMLKR